MLAEELSELAKLTVPEDTLKQRDVLRRARAPESYCLCIEQFSRRKEGP